MVASTSKQNALPISVIIMTKNEERNIAKCIRSADGYGEIFVIDSSSTDRTVEIATTLGATVVQFEWSGKYPKKKQWCLDRLPFTFDWVLYVDADEELTPALNNEIRSIFETHRNEPPENGYFVGYDYLFMGKLLKHGQRAFKLVLLNRHHARFLDYDDLDATQMWEVEGHYQPAIDGSIGVLHQPMLHMDHDDLFHYFDRHNRYSDWEAVVRQKRQFFHPEESQLPARGQMKRLFERMPAKPFAAFFYAYIQCQGFRDGRAGFHFAMARAFYYWQIGIKQNELERKAKEAKQR